MRLGPVIGRKQQMIKLKGTTLYPPSIYDVLNEIDCIENYVIEVSTNEIGTDDLLIYAGCILKNKDTEKSIKDHFRAKLRVAPRIKFLKPNEITVMQMQENSRKPVIFIDKR